MSLSFSRPRVSRLVVRRVPAWPLGALLFVANAPVRAQNAAPQSPSAPVPAPNSTESDAPKLTTESRPASSISTSRRPVVGRPTLGRSLVMAEPEARGLSVKATPAGSALPNLVPAPSKPLVAPLSSPKPLVPVTSIPAAISSGIAAPQTLISPSKPVKVSSKTRFAASRVSSQTTSSYPTNASPTPANPLPNAANNGSVKAGDAPLVVVAPPTPPTFPSFSPRDQMARLPSRGGLMQNRPPIDLQPKSPLIAPPESGAISDSQRRMLAELDADLGRAQRRLDRAENRLTEGQQQLGSFTGVLRSAMLDAGDDARGLHPFVRVAQRYMGTPYVWGGESARGFDCSGFIMRVMRDLGYRALPHSAAEQFHYGLPVAKALLKPGDIVFFANTYKPGVSHVGIYLGRGRFIHAANSKVGTIVSGLNDPKWVEHYAGARRLLPVKS